MLSIDTNLLFFAFAADRPEHTKALSWIQGIQHREDIAISEFVLVELYRLLRNPAVVAHPLSAQEAVSVVSCYRRHPQWKLVGFTHPSQPLHDELYKVMSTKGITYRRIYDARTALSLRSHGVKELATTNTKDFRGLGLERVWNPLEDTGRR